MTTPKSGYTAISLAAWIFMAQPGPSTAGDTPGLQRYAVVVQEKAGIRRFGYPVSVILPLGAPLKDTDHLRLFDKGKHVQAQFRPHGDTRKGIRAVCLDFNVNHAPHQTREYIAEYAPDSKPAPQAKGMKVVTETGQFRVVYSPGLQFIVPRNLVGLLRSVKTSRGDYLRSGSAGLMIRSKKEVRYLAGSRGPHGKPTVSSIVKEGPLASTLRFESKEALGGRRNVRSVVTLQFPLSKSWVQVDWAVDDPHGWVAGLGADLNLNIPHEPALVDFGAGSYVYAHLRKGQSALLRHNHSQSKRPSWETLVGPAGAPTPYVVAHHSPSQTVEVPRAAAEGWAHVMDQHHCTALAVADFAHPKEEADITADADGRLRFGKHFGRKGKQCPKGLKKLRFWLHFVDMPVQVGAVTSPQAMLAPLQVKVRLLRQQ
jgi:hypothetical protein